MLIISFWFQGVYKWNEGEPHSLNQLHDYSLMSTIHIYHEKQKPGQQIIMELEQDVDGNETILCTLLWLKSVHEHHMPWLYIPCNTPHKVDHIICEHAPPAPEQPQQATSGTMTLSAKKTSCPVFWTYVNDRCLRVYEGEQTHDVHYRPALSSYVEQWAASNANIKLRESLTIYLFLENWYHQNSRSNDKWPVLLKVAGRCAYLEKSANQKISWYKKVNCDTHRAIKNRLVQCFTNDIVVEVITLNENIFIYRVYSEMNQGCELVDYKSTMVDQHRMYIHLSAYLSKASIVMADKGIGTSRDGCECKVFYPSPVGEPPLWLPRGNSTACAAVKYLLYQQPNTTTSFECQQNQFRCNDGTCIVLSRRSDGIMYCYGGADEDGCPPACTYAAPFNKHNNISCFNQCVLPHCVCTLLYQNSHNGYCIPMWQNGRHNVISNHFVNDGCSLDILSSLSNLYKHCNTDVQGSDIITLSAYDLPTDQACIFLRSNSLDENAKIDYHLRYCYHHECPAMYKCYHSYCIPYRYVCDGYNDCPSGEEELHCERLVCPGLLKCIIDDICVSSEEVCDNTLHCLLGQDDEWVCDLPKCPPQCLCIGLSLVCTDHSLAHIPEYHAGITVLDGSNNCISSTNISLNVYPNLLKLEMSRNLIKGLKNGMFVSQSHLRWLSLQHNPLTLIPSGYFVGLSSLNTIFLNGCRINTIRRLGFHGLQSLLSLNLSRTHLVNIAPLAFYRMMHVSVLDISHNQITHFVQAVFIGLDNTDLINLSGNYIKHADSDIFAPLHQGVYVVTSSEGICCFLEINSNCISLLSMTKPACKPLISGKRTVVMVLVLTTSSVFSNTAALVLMIVTTVAKHGSRRKHVICLAVCDILLASYLSVILAYNSKFGRRFALFRGFWSQSTMCHSLSFITSFSVDGSATSTMMIVLEWFIVTYYTFNTERKLQKIKPLLNGYLIIPLIFAVSRYMLPVVHYDICFPFGLKAERMLVLHLTLFAYGILVTVATLFLLGSIIYLTENSRRHAERKWSKGDKKMTIRIILIGSSNFLKWAVIATYTLIIFNKPIVHPVQLQPILFIVLGMTATLNPVLFTLSAAKLTKR